MQKSNKIISFLLCVLIILSAANLFLGVTNSYRIKQLESAPPVIIEELTEGTVQTAEPITTAATTAEAEVTTTEEALTSTVNGTTEAEASTERITAQSTKAEPTEQITETKPTETEAPANESGYCYVTASGTKYHKDGCSYLKKSKTKMTVNEAKSSGYSPCSRCY